MSIDEFFHRRYNRETYNCAHFAAEVWEKLTGESIAYKLRGILVPVKDKVISFELRHAFRRLQVPQSPCLVLLQRRKVSPHVGVFIRGRVLHLHEQGVEFQPLEVVSIGFQNTRFYK